MTPFVVSLVASVETGPLVDSRVLVGTVLETSVAFGTVSLASVETGTLVDPTVAVGTVLDTSVAIGTVSLASVDDNTSLLTVVLLKVDSERFALLTCDTSSVVISVSVAFVVVSTVLTTVTF